MASTLTEFSYADCKTLEFKSREIQRAPSMVRRSKLQSNTSTNEEGLSSSKVQGREDLQVHDNTGKLKSITARKLRYQ